MMPLTADQHYALGVIAAERRFPWKATERPRWDAVLDSLVARDLAVRFYEEVPPCECCRGTITSVIYVTMVYRITGMGRLALRVAAPAA